MNNIKRIFIILFLVCFTIMPVFSAIVYQSNGVYGLKDKNNKIVLTAQYQAIEQLTYTPSQKVIIPMHAMDEISVKTLNFYKTKKNNLWGVVNSQGHIIRECTYKNVEADSNGDIKLVLTDGNVEYVHPVINAAKAARDTLVTIAGLPVTLIGAVMIPIEAISKSTSHNK